MVVVVIVSQSRSLVRRTMVTQIQTKKKTTSSMDKLSKPRTNTTNAINTTKQLQRLPQQPNGLRQRLSRQFHTTTQPIQRHVIYKIRTFTNVLRQHNKSYGQRPLFRRINNDIRKRTSRTIKISKTKNTLLKSNTTTRLSHRNI